MSDPTFPSAAHPDGRITIGPDEAPNRVPLFSIRQRLDSGDGKFFSDDVVELTISELTWLLKEGPNALRAMVKAARACEDAA